MIKISIIIVTYNSSSLIEDCINSIYKFNDIKNNQIEIIVVDNSKKEETRRLFDLIRHNYDNKIRLIDSDINLGYGAGNNLGIKYASGEIIAIINPDIRLLEPLFQKTIYKFEDNENLGLLGYKQKGGKNISFYIKPEYDLSFINSLIIKVGNKLDLFNKKYFFLSGAFMFIRRNAFEKIGGFDEDIFMYGEEADISNRLLDNGFHIEYDNKAKYAHLIYQRENWNKMKFLHTLQSRKIYFKKYDLDINFYIYRRILESIIILLVNVLLINKIKINYHYRNIINHLKFLKESNI